MGLKTIEKRNQELLNGIAIIFKRQFFTSFERLI